MKKLVLIIAIAFSILTGCGGGSENPSDENTPIVDENTTVDKNTTIDESKILLLGKTLYYMEANEARTDTYKTATFKDETVTIKTFDLKTDDLINENDLDITYSGYHVNSEIFKKDNSYTDCELTKRDQYSLYGEGIEFECFNGYNNMIHMMRYTKDKAIAYPILSTSRDMTVSSVDIINQNNINAPKINSFIFIGNYVKEDNITATLSNRTNFDFNIKIDLNDTISGNQKVYLFFSENNSSNATNTGNHLEITNTNKSIDIKGILRHSKLNKFQFTFNSKTVTIDDSDKFNSFPANGYLDLFVCEDTLDFNSCNYSSIPVKFKE